jgi:HK97 family phage prohead protease
MLYGGHIGDLELRAGERGGARLSGRFPYGARATLSDGGRTGRPRKEVIRSRAFAYRVNQPNADIHLLVGHSYSAPLASKLAGTLRLRDADDALSFDADIVPEIAENTTYGRDLLSQIRAGLVRGLSPGFRIPPARTVPNAEEIEEEEDEPELGNHRAIIRHVIDALLFELSVVTTPAYPTAQVELRNWNLTTPAEDHLQRSLRRWRA